MFVCTFYDIIRDWRQDTSSPLETRKKMYTMYTSNKKGLSKGKESLAYNKYKVNNLHKRVKDTIVILSIIECRFVASNIHRDYFSGSCKLADHFRVFIPSGSSNSSSLISNRSMKAMHRKLVKCILELIMGCRVISRSRVAQLVHSTYSWNSKTSNNINLQYELFWSIIYYCYLDCKYFYRMSFFRIWIYLLLLLGDGVRSSELLTKIYVRKVSILKSNGGLRTIIIPSATKMYYSKVTYWKLGGKLSYLCINSIVDLPMFAAKYNRRCILTNRMLKYIVIDVVKCFDRIKLEWVIGLIQDEGILNEVEMSILSRYYSSFKYDFLYQGCALSSILAQVLISHMFAKIVPKGINWAFYVDNILLWGGDEQLLVRFTKWNSETKLALKYKAMELEFHKVERSFQGSFTFCGYGIGHSTNPYYIRRTTSNCNFNARLNNLGIRTIV